MEENIDCCVIGDAMIDVIFPFTNSEDFNYVLHGGVTSAKSIISAGGTANVAVDIAQLGGNSAFMGKIGNDCFGNLFKNDLKINNVKDCLAISEEHNTGISFILVLPNKERFFVVDRGANAYLKMDEVNTGLYLNSRYLYISGYSFQDKKTRQTIKSIIKEVSGKVEIVFNPAAPNIAKKYRNEFIDMIKNYVDILILNEKEGKELANSENVFEELLPYVEVIALTKSERGSIVATQNEIHSIKAYPTNVVDTTGAGDAYAAGFIYGLSRGWKVDKAGDFASKIAGMVVSEKGARCDLRNFSNGECIS